MLTKEELIAFETSIAEMFNAGKLKQVVHLSGGNETILINIFSSIKKEDWVFSTWRSHLAYLLKGGSPEKLKQMIIDGRSMHIMDKDINFFSSSIVGGCPSIATGVALGLKRSGKPGKVYCFIGDGAEWQGSFYEAARYSDAHNLPIKFIIEDNGLSVDTPKSENPGTFGWPSNVIRYYYNRKYPHCGTGKFVESYM